MYANMYNQSGIYGYNPHYTLAETPYARMTGMFTPINKQAFPNANSYLQPMFVDMNPYMGNRGIPTYPSFIGATAMQNPHIPIIQPNQIHAWQQAHQNYPAHQQPGYYGHQQPGYYGQQQGGYGFPAQTGIFPQQPVAFPQQPMPTQTIINNYFMGQMPGQTPGLPQNPFQSRPQIPFRPPVPQVSQAAMLNQLVQVLTKIVSMMPQLLNANK